MTLLRLVLACLVTLAFAGGACTDRSGPMAPSAPRFDVDDDDDEDDDDDVGVEDDEPHFVHAAAGAPPLAQTSLTFYAVSGKTRAARIMYRPLPGRKESTEFLRLTVPGDAGLTRPDGSPVVQGDSVAITIAIVDPERLIVDFQPAGLGFGTADPARLRMTFVYADDDLDDDDDIDDDDDRLRRQLAIWRSESSQGSWERLPSTVRLGIETVETSISGFSRYAIAY